MGNYDDFWAQAQAPTPAPTAAVPAPPPAAFTPAPLAPPSVWEPPSTVPAAAPTGWAPAPVGWTPGPPVEAPRASNLLRYGGGFVVAVVALGAVAAGVDKLRSIKPLTTPQSLAGAERLRGAEFDRLTEQAKASIRDAGDRAVAGIYGVEGIPSIIMAAGSGHDYDTLEASYDDAMDGIGTGGFQIDASTTVTLSDAHGKNARCAEFTTPLPGAVCVWLTSRTTGLVFSFGGDIPSTADLAGEARMAVEG
jgi:hypothetical protein